MRPILLDTDILSYFLQAHPQVVARVAAYLQYLPLSLSVVTWYEIVSGLRHHDTRADLDRFLVIAQGAVVLPLTVAAADVAATIYAEQRRVGRTLKGADLLIAGTAIVHGLVLVTHNLRHFAGLPGLEVEDWTEPAEPLS
ncbi:MAG: PIN domain-containing protein [Armatimonadetes bacterium]|nr:PIN domain-containing protein [Armatimonadota bacterium]